jgi:hypothetical protein
MASYNSNQDVAAKKAEDTKIFGQQKAGEAQQATQVRHSMIPTFWIFCFRPIVKLSVEDFLRWRGFNDSFCWKDKSCFARILDSGSLLKNWCWVLFIVCRLAQDAAGVAQDKANQAGTFTGEKWEQTKQGASSVAGTTQQKAGEVAGATQQKASEVAGATQQKAGEVANQASQVAGEKWEQTKQYSSDTAQVASDKAGSVVQQTKDAMNTAFQTLKADVTPKQSTTSTNATPRQ